ncbi:hypothetical protein SASPL_111035 [Salvia splendens]|uniref:Uncharacterized protein n=1 Tax=Salvia splendens TaxID=180675 RepID=A0A8X8Y5Y3_SALSN|nr:hypothetical protein SASPL_111035 [Salvia splendens]
MFFYQGKWTQEMDSLLLSTLITLRSGRKCEDANVPDDVLCNVRAVLNHPFGGDLTTDDIAVRVNLLKARFRRFKKVVDDVKVEILHEVITISDNTEVIVLSETDVPKAPIRGKPNDSPADSD